MLSAKKKKGQAVDTNTSGHSSQCFASPISLFHFQFLEPRLFSKPIPKFIQGFLEGVFFDLFELLGFAALALDPQSWTSQKDIPRKRTPYPPPHIPLAQTSVPTALFRPCRQAICTRLRGPCLYTGPLPRRKPLPPGPPVPSGLLLCRPPP